MRVEVVGSQIRVNGKPFYIRGVIYSPSPIGSHPQWSWPYGDFFIPQYSDLWLRDFPLLKSLGANTIRVYGWNNDLDHGYFLDKAHEARLKVLVTFSLGNAQQSPVGQQWQREDHLGAFMAQFRKYRGHPALLGWTFGEGMNLPANGYLQAFSDAHGCGWNAADVSNDPNGCMNNVDTHGSCSGPVACVYTNFFGYLNLAAQYAKAEMGSTQQHLIIGALSDVDVAWFRMRQFDFAATALDAWGIQIYRGKNFGVGNQDFLNNYENATTHDAKGQKLQEPKPLVVLEYGVDAYNDPCGKGNETPCYNDVLDSPQGGYGEDEDSQASWVMSLTQILADHSSAAGLGAVAGGLINSWVDESWKCTSGVVGCGGPIPYPLPGFDPSLCGWKAHVNCPQLNLWRPSLCGFWTPATFDQYSNQAWYGIVKPTPQRGDVDHLTPRLVYGKLQQTWNRSQDSWIWMTTMIISALIVAAITSYTQHRYNKRLKQVSELEMRSVGGGPSASSLRSPLSIGVPAIPPSSDRRAARAGPAGRSSRALPPRASTARAASAAVSTNSPTSIPPRHSQTGYSPIAERQPLLQTRTDGE